MIDIALKMLLHDRLRFAITVAGVAFAVLLVLFQFGLFLGLLDNASITIEHIRADLWITSLNTPNVDFAHEFPESRVYRVRSVPGVERADNLMVTFMNVTLPSGTQEGILVYALDDFSPWGIPWHLLEGQLDDLRRGPYMVLDDSSTSRFGPFRVGERREVMGRRLTIIGRSQDARSFTTTPIAFLDRELGQQLVPTARGNTMYVLVKLAPGADLETVRAEIKRRLPFNDVHTREEWARISRRYWVNNTGLGFNLFITVFLGCLVGVVVVAQTLYTATMDHLKEFGTVKAIGGSNHDIYRILARQAVVSALVGFVLGLIPAMALRPFFAHKDLKLIIPPAFIALVFAGTIVFCVASAAVSFRKVSSIDPGLVFRG
jgi:putative ABC transport system permease protein